jgi:hypothetical protein
MFLTVTFQGKDRAALMYRYMAVPIFKQLQMSRRFSQLKDDMGNKTQEKRLISTAAWGLFHLEWQVKCDDERFALTSNQSHLLILPPAPFDSTTDRP